ncbi:VOC family protein [Paenibacillus sp. MER TA 81-3]|uniref:VOC family protein n=1 Tax=Paenibacillus sp. MER TA 81-3 TaxID=2939573 RepID=UPI0020412228|nr:VOC family protein [Paenibacillus sp. MER TA 81-3]MCM3341036.1 VOC family protein [Paenibacillus sp. MER TA 81-3]
MKIQEIRLHTSDLQNIKRFYSQVLGLPIMHEHGGGITFQAGASQLTFVHNNEAEAGRPFYHFAFNITESKIEQCVEWLKRKQAAIHCIEGKDIQHLSHWNAHAVYLYDPAGNLIEFIARHNGQDREAGESASFGVPDIQCISEIGLPVEDVPEAAAVLKERYGADVYIAAYPLFAPLGNEEGLLILCSTQRKWFGTDKYAAIHPIEIVLRDSVRDDAQFLQYPYRMIRQD